MKFKIIVLSILVFSVTGLAQSVKRDVDTVKIPVLSRFSISGGIGYSTGMVGLGFIGTIFPIQYNYWPADAELYIDASPEFGASVDYALSNKYTMGLAIGYQSEYFSANPNEIYTDKISRMNIAIRELIHLNKYNNNFDNYFGIRIGCSYWRDENLTSPNLGQVIGAPYLFKGSLQVLYGLTLFLDGGGFGFNFEVGIGTPYLGQAGILFRL